jgi:hypothetical protein
MRPYYEDAFVTIYHGDCRDILPALPVADHVISDPPYDEETHAGVRSATPVFGRISEIEIAFDPLDVASTVPVLLSKARRWVVSFCAMEMLGDYRRAAGEAWIRGGFWRRPDGAPQFTGDRPAQPGDGIAIMHRSTKAGRKGRTRWNCGGSHAYWEYGVERDDRVHPTQKPMPLMAALVNAFTDPGDVILDPFAGSGTTLVAAKRHGRKAIGIELTAAHCASAARRAAATQPLPPRLEFDDDGKRKQTDMFSESAA